MKRLSNTILYFLQFPVDHLGSKNLGIQLGSAVTARGHADALYKVPADEIILQFVQLEGEIRFQLLALLGHLCSDRSSQLDRFVSSCSKLAFSVQSLSIIYLNSSGVSLPDAFKSRICSCFLR